MWNWREHNLGVLSSQNWARHLMRHVLLARASRRAYRRQASCAILAASFHLVLVPRVRAARRFSIGRPFIEIWARRRALGGGGALVQHPPVTRHRLDTPPGHRPDRTRGYRSDNHTPVSQIHRHTHAPHVIHAALRRNTHCALLWGCCSSQHENAAYPLSTLITHHTHR